MSTAGAYSAQWLLYWATSWQQIKPTDFSPVMFALIFGIFSASVPGGQPWLRVRRRRKDS
ncbi:hypothetical protein LK10_01325 [Sinomonas humi]|uniref:Uncharacterized protein n=1 Tax=Sinomonas humi TaxID=1338436 RepID=A0A0B2AP12_9MICC|nr:hypothetical protein LK10_01325 [Sinomonas humi]